MTVILDLKIVKCFFNSNFDLVIHVTKTNDTIPKKIPMNSNYFSVMIFFWRWL